MTNSEYQHKIGLISIEAERLTNEAIAVPESQNEIFLERYYARWNECYHKWSDVLAEQAGLRRMSWQALEEVVKINGSHRRAENE